MDTTENKNISLLLDSRFMSEYQILFINMEDKTHTSVEENRSPVPKASCIVSKLVVESPWFNFTVINGIFRRGRDAVLLSNPKNNINIRYSIFIAKMKIIFPTSGSLDQCLNLESRRSTPGPRSRPYFMVARLRLQNSHLETETRLRHPPLLSPAYIVFASLVITGALPYKATF